MAGIEISLTDNSDLIKDALEDQIEQALIAIGITAENNAKREITRAVYDTPESKTYVRTGRLRNSITFALAGQEANSPTYRSDDGSKSYTYEGRAPNIGGNEHAVYIGSNVEYAASVELGTSKMRARPYLRPAVANYADEYKKLVKQALSG